MAERILLIYGNPQVRAVLGNFLEMFGYAVDTTGDGVEGIAQAQQSHYDLVITDGLTPGLSGWAVADAMRRKVSRTAVVLITGLPGHGVVEDAQARSVPLLLKPFTLAQLERAVAQALGEKTGHEAAE